MNQSNVAAAWASVRKLAMAYPKEVALADIYAIDNALLNPSAPGWKMVPVEPTQEMLNTGAKFSLTLRDAYVEMVRRAELPPIYSKP